MKWNFWQWMVVKDDLLIKFVHWLRDARTFWGLRDTHWARLGRRLIRARQVDGGKVVIVLNAPSITLQPLERLRGEDVVFVNQGFRLPRYKDIHPKYHVFIDTKMIRGVWDVKWLDEILDLVPDITFVMPAAWAGLAMFKPYIDRKIPIIWLDRSIMNFPGHGVSSVCFGLVSALGYKQVYFTGYEATAFASSLVAQASHFYGNDSDERGKPMEVIMQEYYMNARHIRELFRLAKRLNDQGVRTVNLTRGGIVDVFPRSRFEDVFI